MFFKVHAYIAFNHLYEPNFQSKSATYKVFTHLMSSLKIASSNTEENQAGIIVNVALNSTIFNVKSIERKDSLILRM